MTGHLTLRTVPTLAVGLSLMTLSLAASACNPAYAERHHDRAGTWTASPSYSFDIIDENGFPLETHRHRGRVYVLGHANERYVLRVHNPTAHRVEAVVSVDGLDAVDGEPADVRKRGYVIQPFDELRLEGFRVSADEVAAFRFSSVRGSYAGRKGKPRHVGVIGVAIFEERQASTLVLPAPCPRSPAGAGFGERQTRRPSRSLDFEADGAAEDRDDLSPPPPAPRGGGVGGPAADAAVGRAPAQKQARKSGASRSRLSRRPATEAEESAPADRGARCCRPRPQERPGLGTAFGERRQSAATFTRFVRQNSARPNAVLELRYNDASGLQALGIRRVNRDELSTRETAIPFPGDRRFAAPPR